MAPDGEATGKDGKSLEGRVTRQPPKTNPSTMSQKKPPRSRTPVRQRQGSLNHASISGHPQRGFAKGEASGSWKPAKKTGLAAPGGRHPGRQKGTQKRSRPPRRRRKLRAR